ncbi:hypothetical protein ACKI1H_18425 [Pseudomonas sp. YH-1]|uniref:hypothetical protein n=1 Tax=Pseudomonas sp. YH-1 TaxID=3384787 RepID=UPI003F821329
MSATLSLALAGRWTTLFWRGANEQASRYVRYRRLACREMFITWSDASSVQTGIHKTAKASILAQAIFPSADVESWKSAK